MITKKQENKFKKLEWCLDKDKSYVNGEDILIGLDIINKSKVKKQSKLANLFRSYSLSPSMFAVSAFVVTDNILGAIDSALHLPLSHINSINSGDPISPITLLLSGLLGYKLGSIYMENKMINKALNTNDRSLAYKNKKFVFNFDESEKLKSFLLNLYYKNKTDDIHYIKNNYPKAYAYLVYETQKEMKLEFNTIDSFIKKNFGKNPNKIPNDGSEYALFIQNIRAELAKLPFYNSLDTLIKFKKNLYHTTSSELSENLYENQIKFYINEYKKNPDNTDIILEAVSLKDIYCIFENHLFLGSLTVFEKYKDLFKLISQFIERLRKYNISLENPFDNSLVQSTADQTLITVQDFVKDISAFANILNYTNNDILNSLEDTVDTVSIDKKSKGTAIILNSLKFHNDVNSLNEHTNYKDKELNDFGEYGDEDYIYEDVTKDNTKKSEDNLEPLSGEIVDKYSKDSFPMYRSIENLVDKHNKKFEDYAKLYDYINRKN